MDQASLLRPLRWRHQHNNTAKICTSLHSMTPTLVLSLSMSVLQALPPTHLCMTW